MKNKKFIIKSTKTGKYYAYQRCWLNYEYSTWVVDSWRAKKFNTWNDAAFLARVLGDSHDKFPFEIMEIKTK